MENKKLKVMELEEEIPSKQKTEVDSKIEELESLGLSKAALKVKNKVEEEKDIKNLKRKLMLAYENFRYVTPEDFDKFNKALYKKTYIAKGKNGYPTYDVGVFIPINRFEEIPPKEVLLKLKEAKDMNLFDGFEVFKLESVEVRPDPIIFGYIKDCLNKFFIAQWDDDVKIEDILKHNQG